MPAIKKNRDQPKRYEAVLEQYEQTRQQFLLESGMTEDQYIEWEFAFGCLLAENFYEGKDPTKVKHYSRQLLTDEANGFWKWFKAARRQHEFIYLKKGAHILELENKHFGTSLAKVKFIHRWKLMHMKWIKSSQTHRMLLTQCIMEAKSMKS